VKKALLMVLIACDAGEHRAARDRYNEGVALLAKSDYDAAEKALIDARSQAGVDPPLRFRAAYDLGIAYAMDADKAKGGVGQEPDLEKALQLEQQAVSWFADAVRLDPKDADATKNLAIARARVQAISDDLLKDQSRLEKRLDALIGSQRGLVVESRTAAAQQKNQKNPLAQQQAMAKLADDERGIVAEAGVIGDLAGDEIDSIGKKPEDKRSDEEKVRVVQLKNLDAYLTDARGKIAEARRKLQALDAPLAVDRADAALTALKRAREQLLDPITVMKQLAQDELALVQETKQLQELTSLTSGSNAGPVPAWLAGKAQGDRQGAVRERLEEVRARFAAGVEHAAEATQPKDTGGQSVAAPGMDPKQAKMMERVKAALPSVIEASAAMDKAHDALRDEHLDQAGDREQAALLALFNAIEQFSDLKQTIELAYGEQQGIGQALGDDAKARDVGQSVKRNLVRLERLKGLIADEVAQIDPKKDEKGEQKQQLAYAETLRGQAADAIGKLDKALGTPGAKADAAEAEQKLAELRKLFFSVIEHLQQLIRDQGETHDQTAAASADDDFARAPKLPGLIDREGDHDKMAKAIADALAAQADAAGKQPQQPAQPGAPNPKTLAAAADEVKLSRNDMADASATLTKAKTAQQSMTLDPATKSEEKALEHLMNALKLLQPPKQNKDQDKNKQDQQQQDKDKNKDKQDQQQQQQQGGAGQRARDEDAKRQKRRGQPQSEPVDQDW